MIKTSDPCALANVEYYQTPQQDRAQHPFVGKDNNNVLVVGIQENNLINMNNNED